MCHIQKTLHSLWKKKIAYPVTQIDDYVKHIFRKHNQEARPLVRTWEAEGQRTITVEKGK